MYELGALVNFTVIIIYYTVEFLNSDELKDEFWYFQRFIVFFVLVVLSWVGSLTISLVAITAFIHKKLKHKKGN